VKDFDLWKILICELIFVKDLTLVYTSHLQIADGGMHNGNY